MPVPEWFKEIELDEVQTLVKEETPENYDRDRAFFEGDHWQDRDGWIGPHPGPNDQNADVAWEEIERAFTPKGVIAEVINRHEGGVVGREPLWRFIPTNEEDVDPDTGEIAEDLAEDVDQLEDRLADWWDERNVDAVLSEAVDTLLVGGRSSLRIFIPRGLLQDGSVPDGPFEEQLERIYVDDLEPDVAMVYEDPDMRRELGIVVYEIETGNPTTKGSSEKETRAELSWVDDDGITHLRVLRKNPGGSGESENTFKFEFGGNILVHELERPALITETVVRQQKALNLANSMIPRNVITGGFLERILINAQMPGKIEEDPDTGNRKFKPEPLTTGPGSTSFIAGLKEVDEEGEETLKTPQVEFREPVPVEPSRDAKETAYHDILDEVDQKHVIISGDATPSGQSREQARAEYRRSLNRTRTPVEGAVRWLIDTVASMAQDLSNGSTASPSPSSGENGDGGGGEGANLGVLDRLRVDATAIVDDGPVSSEEMRVLQELADGGLLSKESAIKRLGVREVRAEIDRIEDQENSDLTLAKERAEAMVRYTRAGADIVTAAVATGMSEEQAEDVFGEVRDRNRRREDQRAAARDAIGEASGEEEGDGDGEEENDEGEGEEDES